MAHSKSVILRAKGCASLSARETAYRLRGVLPLPLLLLSILWSQPDATSLVVGAAIVALGQAVRAWVAGYLGGQAVDQREGLALIVHGPYGLMQHPRYLGNFLIGIGLSIAANWWIGYVLYAAYCVFALKVLIPVEEGLLLRMYGEQYQQYQLHVHRLWPRLSRSVIKRQGFACRDAIAGEKHMLLFILAIGACFAAKWLLLGTY